YSSTAALKVSNPTLGRSSCSACGKAVTATTRAFDTAAAREFGVPEGPAFGKLSAGQSVEVDGETVAPEDVSKERLVEFSV
ncbi:hypothetical protein PM085_20895, partial [Halorubrum ezzemoulense]|nr:hypothetical protein [Halorubrum ezzemoulense]